MSQHRIVFIFLAIVLALTSALAPMPDIFTRNIDIGGSGGQLGLQKASAASGDILPSTIGQVTTPTAIAFSDNGTHLIFNNWQLIFSYSKTTYTDLIFSPTGELLADSSSFQFQVDAYKFDIQGSVSYEKISDTEYELTRTFLATDYDATFKLIYNITMQRNKLTIDFQNGSRAINKNVAFNWLQSLLTDKYVETGDQLTFDSGKKQVTFDWSDAAAYTHAIAVTDTAKGKQAEIKFTVGSIARDAHIIIDPSVVGSTTTDLAIDLETQRKVVYAASRFWVFYSDDGDGIVYTSSLDGITWAADQTLKADSYYGESVSIWYDSDNICIAYSEEAANKPIEYCQFTPYDNGTLSAQTAWQTVIAGDAGTSWDRVSVCKDTNGYPYISYLAYADQDAYVTRSNQNDGTWTSCNFTTALITTNQYWNTAVVPQLNGKVMAIYAYSVAGGATIKSKVWNGSAWGGENTTTQDTLYYWNWSVVSTSDGVVHLVFLEQDANDITYTHYHDGGTAWQTEEVIYAGTDFTVVPVLSKTLDNNLNCFWMGDNITDHIFYKAQIDGTWDTVRTDWLTEVDIYSNALISCTYSQTTTNYIPTLWLVEDGANYDVRFGALELSDNTGVSITCTPDNVTGAWAYLSGGGSPTQYLRGNQWYSTETGITWGALKFTLSNNGTEWCDILISSDNWTGLGKTWYLSDTATPGVSTIGLKAGIVYSTPGYFLVGENTTTYYVLGFAGSENETEYVGRDFSGTSDYTKIVKRNEPWNYLTTGLCPTCSVWWGFKILLPTSSVGNAEMTGIITLTATAHT